MKTRFLICLAAAILGVASVASIVISVQEQTIQTVNVDILKGAANPQQKENLRPETITVMIGVNNTIQWNNLDNTPHTLTPDHRYGGFASGTPLLRPGESYSITFEKPGVFDYHGSPGPWITGTVIVKENDSWWK